MGLKIFLIVIGIGLILATWFLGATIWENASITEDKIEEKAATLLSDPIIFKDEYNQDTVAIRFFVVDEKLPLVVPGKLLRTLDKRIYDLKEGDQISYWKAKGPSPVPLPKPVINLFGLSDEKGAIIKPSQALEFYGKIDYLVFTVLVLLFSAAVYVFWQYTKL